MMVTQTTLSGSATAVQGHTQAKSTFLQRRLGVFIIYICSHAVCAPLLRPIPLALAGEGMLKFPSKGTVYGRARSSGTFTDFSMGMNVTWLHW